MAAAIEPVFWPNPEGLVYRSLVELAAGVTLYYGARVMVQTTGATSPGFFGPADSTEPGYVVGECIDPAQTVDNSAGADGAKKALIEWSVPKKLLPFNNDQGGVPLTKANRGSIVNALDDTTVTGAASTCVAGRFFGLHSATSGNISGQGVFDRWDPNGLAWIEVQ